MKKRLLITSIVMMLVCAVALSTATYAWFTSNTTVSASVVTLKAATSDKSALGIGWTGDEAGTFITSAINAILEPMAPEIYHNGVLAELTDGTTTYEIDGTHNQQFYTSNIKQEGSLVQFNNEDINVKPVVYTKAPANATADVSTGNSFYIVNMSTANVLDTVVVSGVFTDQGTSGNYRYIIADTNREPDSNETYYFKDSSAEGYSEVTGGDLDFLTNHGFDNEKTYYVRESRYVLTSDTNFKEDTTYYTRTGTDPNFTYAEASVVVGEAVTANTYYELRDKNGDDMIRIALFTKEYRYADATQCSNEKTYYWINPETGKLAIYQNATAQDVTAHKLLEVSGDKHTLLGVLGKNATTFTKVPNGTAFDMNTVYYTLGDKVEIDVSAGTFADLKAAGLFTKNGSNEYVAVANDATYDLAETYYKQGYNRVANPAPANIGDYYTAATTVVNGEITINKNVKAMNYYTNVNKSLDLATELKPGELIDIIAVIWLDGTDLDDTRSDEYAQVSLKFDSVRNTHTSINAEH